MKTQYHLISKLLSVTLISAFIVQHTLVQAQVLEEVVVTAQRRVQNLQDVPISIETVSGDALRELGFRDLRTMAGFTPGLVLDENGMEDNMTTIRGAGTGGKNRGMEQAAPTFVDGIHFGRPSSNRSAFLDVERVEVLKGPQPVFFGQNATAGAISIMSKRPGDELEGYLEAEVGRFGNRSFEGAVTLPVTDTFGLRFAGRMETTDGHLRDWFTGEAFPNQDIKIGRVIAQWTPTDRLQATAKFEYGDQEFGDDQYAFYKNIHSDNPDLRFPRTVLLTGYEGSTARPIDLAVGEITRLGMRNGPLYVSVPFNVRVANTSAGDRGVFDTTTRTPENMDVGPGWRGYEAPEPFKRADFTSITNSNPYNGYLELQYELTDQIQLTSLTGYSNLDFDTVRGATSPWATGNRFRGETFDQWSQELRLTSDTGGKFEWMVGAYWQQNNLNTQSDSWEANQRFAMRGNRAWEDSEWLSAFAAITYNINEQFSIDLGGRYSKIDKVGAGYNVESWWIVEDPVTGLPSVRPTGVQMPLSFHQAPVVGRTPYHQGPGPADGDGGVHGEVRERDFNPQVVLRYRPTDNISTYFKYAKATKAGGFDTGVAWLTLIDDDFTFDKETTTIFEGGLRASVFDGAGEVGVTVFKSKFKDLQLSSLDEQAIPSRNRTHNAGEQKSDGVEINGRYAFSDRLIGTISLAYMDAVMTDFAGASCTRSEAATGLCTGSGGTTINRSGQPARNAPEWSGSAQFNYWMPITDNYKADFTVNMMASDGWIHSSNWDRTDMMPSHWDASTTVTFSDMDDIYSLMLFARNLNAARFKYYPEYDIFDEDGISSIHLGQNHFTTYGVRIGYRF